MAPSFVARTVAVALLVVVGAGACLSASPPPKSYLLSAASPLVSSGRAAGPVVGVGPVAIPAYLDRSPIVLRTGSDEVRLSGDHHWAEPLRDGVPRVLAENLSTMIPTDAVAIFPWRTPWTVQYRVTVEILRFDGPLGGPAVLNARWRLLDPSGKELVLRAVNLSEAVTGPSHVALVAAQSRLLAAVSRDIASEIKTRR
jgi:uncharacterized protein